MTNITVLAFRNLDLEKETGGLTHNAHPHDDAAAGSGRKQKDEGHRASPGLEL